MNYSEALTILSQAKLSPEKLAPLIGISNMTYRRWLQRENKETELSLLHERGVREAIRVLRLQNVLPSEGGGEVRPAPTAALDSISEDIHNFQSLGPIASNPSDDRLESLLQQIGSKPFAQSLIDESKALFDAQQKQNPKLSKDLRFLLELSRKKGVPRILKSLACGALLYFITPLDMIPDFNIGVGYIDDYGIIAFAAAFCQSGNFVE